MGPSSFTTSGPAREAGEGASAAGRGRVGARSLQTLVPMAASPVVEASRRRREKRRQLDARRSKCRIRLGGHMEQWCLLKERLGFSLHSQLAKFLLDRYTSSGCVVCAAESAAWYLDFGGLGAKMGGLYGNAQLATPSPGPPLQASHQRTLSQFPFQVPLGEACAQKSRKLQVWNLSMTRGLRRPV